MFHIDKSTKQIEVTRGDVCVITITAIDKKGDRYTFKEGDVLRLNVYTKKDMTDLKMSKDVVVTEGAPKVDMSLSSQDTKIGDLISKPKDYWYEIVLNPDTSPQTIVGYDQSGSKKFTIYPEGMEGNI